MSDFLNHFQKDQYQGRRKEEQPECQIDNKRKGTRRSNQETWSENGTVDQNFNKKKRRKRVWLISAGIFLLITIWLAVYCLNHTEMPDFQNKTITDVRSWAAEHRIKVEMKQEYSKEKVANTVLKQPVPKGKSVKKGGKLIFVVSQGADPEEQLALPDFTQLSEGEAKSWLKKNQIERLKVVNEYQETIEKGKFIRLEMKGEASVENFKRKDAGTLYYSKGKEVYKKEIAVPDFVGKAKGDVEAWAKSNEIELSYKDMASKEYEMGKILSQSIPAKEKIAKKTAMEIEVSAGKPIIVPDFNELNAEEALASKSLEVTVKHQYHPDIPYGQLIEQSIAAGTELTEKDELKMTVIYSAGRPFLKDVVGETEGDLQKIFFDEYQSKGANIHYIVKYVSSPEKKGTVVGMSAYNLYVPLTYTVEIRVSTGLS